MRKHQHAPRRIGREELTRCCEEIDERRDEPRADTLIMDLVA